MLSIPDMALIGTAALIFFGPEQLPKVARKVGLLMRDVQNTSQMFIREMERAADEPEAATPYAAHDPHVYGAYDGGYVASPEAHDVPIDEHHGPSAAAAPADAVEHVALSHEAGLPEPFVGHDVAPTAPAREPARAEVADWS